VSHGLSYYAQAHASLAAARVRYVGRRAELEQELVQLAELRTVVVAAYEAGLLDRRRLLQDLVQLSRRRQRAALALLWLHDAHVRHVTRAVA